MSRAGQGTDSKPTFCIDPAFATGSNGACAWNRHGYHPAAAAALEHAKNALYTVEVHVRWDTLVLAASCLLYSMLFARSRERNGAPFRDWERAYDNRTTRVQHGDCFPYSALGLFMTPDRAHRKRATAGRPRTGASQQASSAQGTEPAPCLSGVPTSAVVRSTFRELCAHALAQFWINARPAG